MENRDYKLENGPSSPVLMEIRMEKVKHSTKLWPRDAKRLKGSDVLSSVFKAVFFKVGSLRMFQGVPRGHFNYIPK